MEGEKKYRAGSVIWTDGSKLSQGNLGAAVSWKDKDLNRWKTTSLYLGENKEILDALRTVYDNSYLEQPQYALNNI